MVLDVSILGVVRCEGDELKKLVKLIRRVFVPFPVRPVSRYEAGRGVLVRHL